MERFVEIQQETFASYVPRAGPVSPEVQAVKGDCNGVFNTSWAAPTAQLPATSKFRCCRVFDIEHGAWPENFAKVSLSPKERETWLSLPGREKRRREWLLGRLAVKDAVRMLVRERNGLEFCLADIEILTDEHGRPMVCWKLTEKLGCHLSISVAHSRGEAVGIAGECGNDQGVGIDIEPIDRKCQEGLEKIVFGKKEQSLFSAAAPLGRQEWLLRLWCAKEAVAKALGRGMLGGPLSLAVQELETRTGRVAVTLDGKLARELPAHADKLFTAYTGREDGLAFATAFAG
jgi:phosphopantetheine--protein transferase-like protein